MKQISQSQTTPGMLLRALVKALILFAVFNGAYAAIQPIRSGRIPTLYNTFVPGLARLMVGDEYSIRRLLADHAIQRAHADHFNVVILGSSEIWGVTTSPDGTIPAFLDRQGLIAPDGRPVSIYNLSYPGPDILKDFLIWDSLREAALPIDLVILTVNNGAFARDIEHQLLTENGEHVLKILADYNLDDSLLIGAARPDETTFWADRQDLASWLKKQAQAFSWAATRQDRPTTPLPDPPRTDFLKRDAITPSTRQGVLEAFAQSTSQADVPLLVMIVPLASVKDPFVDWMISETDRVSVPLLDCSAVLAEPSFFEGSVHLMPSTHPIFAQILADSLSQKALTTLELDAPPDHPRIPVGDTRWCSVYPVSS